MAEIINPFYFDVSGKVLDVEYHGIHAEPLLDQQKIVISAIDAGGQFITVITIHFPAALQTAESYRRLLKTELMQKMNVVV